MRAFRLTKNYSFGHYADQFLL